LIASALAGEHSGTTNKRAESPQHEEVQKMNKITATDIAAYVEAEWERRATVTAEGMKPVSIQLIASKSQGEAVKIMFLWHEDPELPPLEKG
jgi:hypothetical protein